jgi:hypothetical protein
VTFGAEVRCVGRVVVTADGPRQIPDGAVLAASP